jgi:hypothetical protein
LKMTPQTAAALRALVTEIRAYEGDPFGTAKHEFQEWADRLAAVLTQDGADTGELKCQSCGSVFTGPEWQKLCAACFERGDVAPAEPRAAEGAGTDYCKSCDGTGDVTDITGEWHGYCPVCTPTAAAAVPAGGDAEVVRLRAVIERDRTLFAECVERMRTTIGVHWWMVESRGSYEWDDKKYQDEFGDALERIKAEVEKIAQRAGDLSDSPRTDAELKAARAAPAPRGGVTEAIRAGCDMQNAIERLAPYIDDEGDWAYMELCAAGNRFVAAIKATPPAAQAQDAGPMARGK